MRTKNDHEKFDLHSSPRSLPGPYAKHVASRDGGKLLNKKYVGAGLGIAATLAMVAFVVYRWRTSGFSWHEFTKALANVDWSWLALALALILATYVGRAMRWEVMLRPLQKHTSLWRVFSATAIGFTAVVLFGRAGEPVRPYLIAKKEGVTFSSQVAAWVVERMLDLLMVLVIFGMALSQISRSAIQHGPRVKIVLEAGGYMAGIIGAACLALLLGLRQFRGNVQKRLMDGLSFLPAVVCGEDCEGPGIVRRRDGIDAQRHPDGSAGALYRGRVVCDRGGVRMRVQSVSGDP